MGNEILKQEQVDEMMARLGREAFEARLKQAKSGGHETSTTAGRRLMGAAIETFEEAVAEWVKTAKHRPGRKHIATRYLEQVNPAVVAMITAQITLDTISQIRPFLSIAYRVARAIEDEAKFASMKRDHPHTWEELERTTDTKDPILRRRMFAGAARTFEAFADHWDRWPRDHCYHLGTVCVELMAEVTGMFEVTNRMTTNSRGRPRQQTVITAAQETLEWIEAATEHHKMLFPHYMPMVIPPRDWKSPWDGGYDANVHMRWPLFQVRDRSLLQSMKPQDMPEVYSCINTLQATAWEINDDVFAMFDHYWAGDEGRGGVAGLPHRDPIELPPRPPEADTSDEAHADWKREASLVHRLNAKMQGKRVMTAKVHLVARTFQHQPFYFPYKVDFRGRIYPIPPFLNPQGNDLAKGLLRFAEARPITTKAARDWLAIHGANCWGQDKATLADRIQWVEDNEEMLRACSTDPIGVRTWIEADGGDSAWQALAFAFEWDALRTAEEAGEVFASKLPVAMDGSNNGLQLYSLLLRDEVGARSTNVSPGDKPEDVYQDVADIATAKLVEMADTCTEEITTKDDCILRVADIARNWLSFTGGSVGRATTKRPVMVMPYSATLYSCQDYVAEWLFTERRRRGLDAAPFRSIYHHVRRLSGLIWDGVHDTAQGAASAMSWLQDIAAICTKAGKTVRWYSPTGMLCEQRQTKQTTRVIKTTIGTKVRQRRARTPTDELSPRHQRNGIAPNYIHSLDAALLTKTVNRCAEEGVSGYGMVHDSYATHAADAPTMARILRETIRDVFSADLLEDFRQQVAAHLGVDVGSLPPTPPYGNLDPACVTDSLYIFS